MTTTPKRILFLMSDTGGGHRAAAEAIEEAIHHLYPNRCQVSIVDIWRRYTPWPLNRLPDTYSWLVGPGLPLWNVLWRLQSPGSLSFLAFSLSPWLKGRIRRLLDQERPDLVVTVHPLLNHTPLRVMRSLGIEVPFITVVTDMVTAPLAWFCPDADFCTVPTEPARQVALKAGLDPARVEVVGQPVSLRFVHGVGDKAALRGKLGLDLNRPVVLIAGGGEGFGPIYDITRTVAGQVSQAQLLVVCGRNKELKARLEAIDWPAPTHIFGFVTNMPELMSAADILISKAGPGMISEAFIAGLPLILFGYIPGQENGNVTFVREHGAGAYAEDPREIARIVGDWLRPGSPQLQEMAARAAALARPDASLNIARHIATFLD